VFGLLALGSFLAFFTLKNGLMKENIAISFFFGNTFANFL